MQLLELGTVGECTFAFLWSLSLEEEKDEEDERLLGTPEKRVGLFLAVAAAAAAAALFDARKLFKAAVATAPATHPKAKFTDMVFFVY